MCAKQRWYVSAVMPGDAGKKQTFREYIVQMSIAGLREEPAQDWLSLHKRLASDGLYITMQEGELVVKDGWDRAREGVALSSFGPLWTAEKLGAETGGISACTDRYFQSGGDTRSL
ncbi:relaxase/mobilization nuclease domain-containing protein [Escherichia coli]|nr:relaxase/mobilization nuclease domain-containing protein [Escherichia coli]